MNLEIKLIQIFEKNRSFFYYTINNLILASGGLAKYKDYLEYYCKCKECDMKINEDILLTETEFSYLAEEIKKNNILKNSE